MKKTVFCALLLLASGPALAWSREGHELVGALAERRLSPAAREQVQTLLAGEPVPTLAGVAAWADEIREESRNAGNPLGELSTHWHYLNLPRTPPCDYVPARDCPDGDCVIGAINAQRAILADRSRPDAERAIALKFLVHFVGDVHQPMHAGYRDDRGGNNFQVQYRGRGAPDGEGTNLHRIWDYRLLRSAGLDHDGYVHLLSWAAPGPPSPPASDNPPRDWALESCRLIHEDAIYPRRHVIDDAYLEKHRPTAEWRIRQAAERLAALLEAALATPATH